MIMLQNSEEEVFQDHMVSYLKKELENENLSVEFEFLQPEDI